MTKSRPQVTGRKEVRQFAKWLTRKGWVLDGVDGSGHPFYRWPATGARLSLPTTPRGDSWRQILRSKACTAMGLPAHAERPNHRRSRRKPTTSGFNLEAAVKDQRRAQSQSSLDAIDGLWERRDEQIDRLVALAAHPSFTSAADGRTALDRIRAIEADLRAYGERVHPFDLTDLDLRRGA